MQITLSFQFCNLSFHCEALLLTHLWLITLLINHRMILIAASC
jgi:hypothetical protein